MSSRIVTPAGESSPLKGMRNPLRGSIVGDPWLVAISEFNVSLIHQDVFDKCCLALEHVRSGNPSSVGLVIHGAAGSGKTHLIGRLRQQLTDICADPTYERASQAFAYIRLNTNSSSLARHVRRCVADDLLRPTGRGLNQFERLVLSRFMEVADGGGHLESWHQHLLEERRDEIPDLLFELGQRARLSPNFVHVLQHLLLRKHRLEVAGWLRGDPLTEKAYDRLEVVADDSDVHPEDGAKRMLVDFMRLSGPQVPVVLCFDQVEALETSRDDNDALFAYGQLVSELHDAEKNVVLISCIQSSFYDRVKQFVPKPAQDRMGSFGGATLNPLSADEAILLLTQRLSAPALAKGRPADATALWPFTEAKVRKYVGIGCTPRKLLDDFSQMFDDMASRPVKKTSSLEEWLSDEWERRYEIAIQQNTPAQSAEILRNGLPHLLNILEPNWKVGPVDERVALDYILTLEQTEAQVGVLFCEEDGTKLSNQLKSLDKVFPKKLGLRKLVLVRDERRPINKFATKAIEYLGNLESKGAVFYRVPPQALAAMDAIRLLLADTQSGDLDRDGDTVEVAPVIDWIRLNLPGVLKEMIDHFVTQGQVEVTPNYVDQLQEYLTQQPVAAVADASAALQISTKELTSIIGNRLDLFGIISGEPSVVFSSRLGSRALNASE